MANWPWQTTSANTGNLPKSLFGQLAQGAGSYGQAVLPSWSSSTASFPSIFPAIPVLEPETAAALIADCDNDETLISKGRRLKFGVKRGQKLTRIELEYLVSLGKAVGKLRKVIAVELRRRQAVKRLTAHSK